MVQIKLVEKESSLGVYGSEVGYSTHHFNLASYGLSSTRQNAA